MSAAEGIEPEALRISARRFTAELQRSWCYKLYVTNAERYFLLVVLSEIPNQAYNFDPSLR